MMGHHALLTVAILFSGGNSGPNDDVWRSTARCGVNATYAFLRLHDRSELTYSDVLNALPVDSDGASLADISDFLTNSGLPSEAVRTTPSALHKLHMPVIAHLYRESPTKFALSERGHYVVLLRVDDGSVTYIDGSSAAIRGVPFDLFARDWSGCVIKAIEPRGPDSYGVIALTVTSLVIVVTFFVLKTRTLRLVANLSRYSALITK
jgi:hypothetical protein